MVTQAFWDGLAKVAAWLWDAWTRIVLTLADWAWSLIVDGIVR